MDTDQTLQISLRCKDMCHYNANIFQIYKNEKSQTL